MILADTKPVRSLYVHVPFCARKCAYCAFYSEASDGDIVNRYVSSLILELERLAGPGLNLETLYFGGGTPSLLTCRQWEQILNALKRVQLWGAAEWTIESNPATVSLEKARLWRSHGVNRISLGVQSLDETLLDRLGRIHSRSMVFKSYDVLRQAGFDNINLDLMFAIPGQTMGNWRDTLEEVLAMGSEHLSCYELIYEEDTPLFELLQTGCIHVNEDLACAMYEELLDRSASRGFIQYEIANLARNARVQKPVVLRAPRETNERLESAEIFRDRLPLPQFACRHNVNYWRGGSYYGLGPSAAGYVGGRRTKNVANATLYCEKVEQGDSPVEWTETLPSLARAGEIAAFGLRMNRGWAFDEFRGVSGYDLFPEWESDIQELVARGWGEISGSEFHLSETGLRFADAAAAQFLRT
jgi:coproporphyrinogen III oxidase-like Fe-S oxidoreductase